jgi:hypothetical protein
MPDAAASTASCPASVTIARAPLWGQDENGYTSDLGLLKIRIFFQKGLDKANHVDPVQQIIFSRKP